MDCYEPKDITEFARKEAERYPLVTEPVPECNKPDYRRCPAEKGGGQNEGNGGYGRGRGNGRRDHGGKDTGNREERVKIKTTGCDTVSVNKENIDMRYVEQLADNEQMTSLGYILNYAGKHYFDGRRSLQAIVDEIYNLIEKKGIGAVCEGSYLPSGLCVPRKQEIFACMNRYPGTSLLEKYGRNEITMGENWAEKIIGQVEKVIIGKREALELAVICLLSEGHLLIEDVPGVGKTTLARTLAQTLGCQFGRIQFTPDTLPSDVTGVSVYQMNSGTFRYMPGGIMNQIVLADEINRATPKTQASLLEAMEERQVSVDGTTYPLPKPFMVMATENPVDELGTYQLPEAQLDRFFLKLSLGYPNRSEEERIVEEFLHNREWKTVESVVDGEEILRMQEEVKQVQVHPDLISFILNLVEKTRESEYLVLGASPRAVLALIRGAQASAYVEGREYVIPDDVTKVLYPILCHRLILTADAKMNQMTPEKVISEIRRTVVLPVLSSDAL